MRFGLGATVSKVAAVIGVAARGLSYIKNNLKIYFDFKSSDAKTLEFVGTGSLDFDDDDEQAVRTGITSTNFGKAITVTAWVTFRDAVGNRKGLFGSDYYINSDFSIHHHSTGSNYAMAVTTKSGTVATFNNVTDATNKWVHLAIVIDQNIGATNNCKLYANGALSGTSHTQSTADIECTDEICIGMQGYTDSQTTGNSWNGKIAKVGFWTRALSVSEVQNVMYKSYSNLKGSELTHLRNWWELDNISTVLTPDVPDSHGSNPGTRIGTASTPTIKTIYDGGAPIKARGFDNAPTAQADLIGSGSAVFDGDDDYIQATGTFPDDDYTITAWFKTTDVDQAQGIVSWGDEANYERRAMIIYNGGSGTDWDLVASIYNENIQGGTTITENKWHHGAITVNKGTKAYSIYLDGALETSGTFTNSLVAFTGTTLYIGRTGTGEYFEGNIAQVGVFNAVLTQEQIQSIKEKTYSELTTSEKTNLVSWWGLDSKFGNETQAAVVPDNNGVLGDELLPSLSTSNYTGGSDLTLTMDGNELNVARDGSSDVDIALASPVTLETNTKYLFEIEIGAGSSSSGALVNIRADEDTLGNTTYFNAYIARLKKYAIVFTSDSTDTGFLFQIIANVNSQNFNIVSISLKKITSGNYGTIV